MYSETTLLKLVGLIYDAAGDPAQWPGFLSRYQELLSARNVALGYIASQPDKMLVIATGADEGDIRKYHQYPCPWLDRLMQANWRSGGAGASHHLITDNELESTVCFNEFLGPRRFHYGMGAAILALADGPATFVTLREKHKGPYSDDDLAFLRALLPHMSRAFQLYGRVLSTDSDRRALADSLDRLATGLVLLDATGRVLFANKAARSIADPQGRAPPHRSRPRRRSPGRNRGPAALDWGSGSHDERPSYGARRGDTAHATFHAPAAGALRLSDA